MEYYSVTKRREALTRTRTWANLENMILSEKPDAESYGVNDPIDRKHPE